MWKLHVESNIKKQNIYSKIEIGKWWENKKFKLFYELLVPFKKLYQNAMPCMYKY